MTFIFNFCSLAASVFCLSAGFRFNHSYLERKMEILKAYAKGFFSVSLAYFFLALPGISLFDPFWVQIAFILSDLSFLIAILFSGPAIFSIPEKLRRFKKHVFLFLSAYIFIYILLNIIFFSPALPLKENNTIYFWFSGTPLIQSMARGLSILAALLMSAFFFNFAKESQEKTVSYRSFLLGLATLGIATSGFIFWFSPFFYFSSNLLILSGVLGLASFMIGILIKEIV